MDAPIPVVRAAARVDVELLSRAVDLPSEIAVLELAERIHMRALQIHVRHDETAEMRRVRDAAASAGERRIERDRAHDHDEVLRRDREQHHVVDRTVGKVERVCEQQPVDRARRADDVRPVQLLRCGERQQGKQHREDARADPGHEVELQEVPRAPDPLELGAEHPQRQHVEEDMKQPAVQEHVGAELPDPEPVDDEERNQAERLGERPHDELCEKDDDVGADERLHRGRERPGPNEK